MTLKSIKLILSALLTLACIASSYATVLTISNATAPQSVSGTPGPAYFAGTDFGSTGTGVIDPFLRIQNPGSEQGMNTSFVGNYLDNKQPLDGYTRDLPLANLGTVTVSGLSGNFYEFFLDVNQNQPPSDPDGLISLTELRIYVTSQKTTEGQLDALRNGLDSTATVLWDMAAGNEVQIKTGSGSGNGDLAVFIPVPSTPFPANSYVYLYSEFGTPGAYPSNDGFEEWRSFNGTPLPPVPDGGATAMMLGAALSGLALLRRKFA